MLLTFYEPMDQTHLVNKCSPINAHERQRISVHLLQKKEKKKRRTIIVRSVDFCRGDGIIFCPAINLAHSHRLVVQTQEQVVVKLGFSGSHPDSITGNGRRQWPKIKDGT